eukprot:5201054-Lingulodinium_polyedra.AAC.1
MVAVLGSGAPASRGSLAASAAGDDGGQGGLPRVAGHLWCCPEWANAAAWPVVATTCCGWTAPA